MWDDADGYEVLGEVLLLLQSAADSRLTRKERNFKVAGWQSELFTKS